MGHDVTVLSRNKNIPSGAVAIIADRLIGIQQLKNAEFDATIDFICADDVDVNEIFSNFNPGQYVLISTVWLAKREGSPETWPVISSLTEKYLTGKKKAENAVNKQRSLGRTATSLRLPIQSGCNDHTKRLLFYFDRMIDGQGIIRVNAGKNIVQIVSSNDIANALAKAISSESLVDIALCDAMPECGEKVKDILQIMAAEADVDWFDMTEEKLKIFLPEYLDEEPFWQEYQLPTLENNLFKIAKVQQTPIKTWIKPIKDMVKCRSLSELRKKEIALINGEKNVIY